MLYVADWMDENNGGISFTDYDVKRATVRLLNPNMLSVCCDKFPENALPIKKGAFHSNVSVSRPPLPPPPPPAPGCNLH